MYFNDVGFEGPSFFSGFDIMFFIISTIVFLIFAFVIITIIKNAIEVAKDKKKPIVPTNAKIVSRRTNVWGEHSHTDYYVTFELDNGERIEFKIPDNKYGYLVEGDKGILSFQGKLFVEFKRTANEL